MSHEHNGVRYCDCTGRRIGAIKDIDPELHLCEVCIEKEELDKDMAFLRQLRLQTEEHEERMNNLPSYDEIIGGPHGQG